MSFIKKIFLPLFLIGAVILMPSLVDKAMAEVRVQKVLGVDVNVWSPGVGGSVDLGGYSRGYGGGYYTRAPYYNPYTGCYYYNDGYCYDEPFSDFSDCYWNYTNGFWIYTCP